jgi:hypothetical protein
MERHYLRCDESRSLKEAYALMFTNPSKLEAVKAKFNSIKEPEQVNETNIDFTQINNIESKEYTH